MWLTGVVAQSGLDPGPGDDDRHADVALEERLVVVPEVARGHPVQAARLRARALGHPARGPGLDRELLADAAVQLLLAQRARLERRVLAVVAGEDDRRVGPGGLEQAREPRVDPGQRALVGVAAVAAVLERARVLARRVEIPEVDDPEPRLLALGAFADALEEPRAPFAVDGPVGHVAVLGLAEPAGETGVVEERPGQRGPGAPAGAAELLGEGGDVLGELRPAQRANAVTGRRPSREERRERGRRGRAGRVGVGEVRAIRGEGRRGGPGVAMPRQKVGAQAIHDDDEKTGHSSHSSSRVHASSGGPRFAPLALERRTKRRTCGARNAPEGSRKRKRTRTPGSASRARRSRAARAPRPGEP